MGTIAELNPGDSITVRSSPILGFGATRITGSANIVGLTDIRTQSGFVFLFLIYVNPGGG